MDDEQHFFRPIWDDFDGELFQDLIVDLLAAEQYQVDPSGVGPDGGVDAFATEHIRFGYNNPEPFVWAVQCKFISGSRAISPGDVGEILNVISDERFKNRQISGFFLATNGRLSTNMMSQLRGLNGRLPGFKTTYIHRPRLHDLLNKHPNVYRKYFWEKIEKQAVAVDKQVANDPTKLLEQLINNQNTSEADLSAFFQSHPNLLAQTLGSNGEVYPQVRLGADYIADFLVEPQPNEAWIIVELRSPKHRLFTKHGSHVTLSNAAIQSIAQIRDFARFFSDPVRRGEFATKYGMDVFKPRLVLFMGRDHSHLSHNEIIELKSYFPEIEIFTYQDIFRRLRGQ